MASANNPCDGCGAGTGCRVHVLLQRLPAKSRPALQQQELRADAEVPVTPCELVAVRTGVVKIICQKKAGSDAAPVESVIDFRLPGQLVGLESWTEQDMPLPTFKSALTMTSLCRTRLPAEDGRPMPRALCDAVNDELAQQIRASYRRRLLQSADVKARLACFVLSMVGSTDGGAPPRLPGLARKDIASYTTMRVETVSRLLGEFRDHGWIRGPLHRIEVLDVAALRALAPPIFAAG